MVSQKVELDRDYVVETMEIDGRTYTQKQARSRACGWSVPTLHIRLKLCCIPCAF